MVIAAEAVVVIHVGATSAAVVLVVGILVIVVICHAGDAHHKRKRSVFEPLLHNHSVAMDKQ